MLLPHLTEKLKNFDGKILKRPGGINLMTQEGAKAVEEAINYLKN